MHITAPCGYFHLNLAAEKTTFGAHGASRIIDLFFYNK